MRRLVWIRAPHKHTYQFGTCLDAETACCQPLRITNNISPLDEHVSGQEGRGGAISQRFGLENSGVPPFLWDPLYSYGTHMLHLWRGYSTIIERLSPGYHTILSTHKNRSLQMKTLSTTHEKKISYIRVTPALP